MTITRFPDDISYGSLGGPEYQTDIVTMLSGKEQRNRNWSAPRYRYHVSYGVRTAEQMAALIAFFHAHHGRATPFRFKDWTDYRASNQTLGVGDGLQTQFQLIKHYQAGECTKQRAITKPVAESCRIYVNGVVQNSGVNIDQDSGIVTFQQAPEPNAEIHADFEFDVWVRFDTDQLLSSLDDFGQYSARDITLVEVK